MITTNHRLSFELFPAKSTTAIENLLNTADHLKCYEPDFFSMTYGAGGSTRDNTLHLVKELRKKDIAIAPHLSFGSDSEETILALIKEYQSIDVNRIVALRGDNPADENTPNPVYASELVEFIRHHTGQHFQIEVAAYPEIHPLAPSYDQDIVYLKKKLDAGANNAITQYFYNIDAYFYFVDQCQKQGIDQPIYPGIMPIHNFKNLLRFSQNCEADIPRWMIKRIEGYGDDTESINAFGIELVTDMCSKLLERGAPGLHFYTMNHINPTAAILDQLR
jgi:methylenetetrahydrofolate reductase (NADPH)